MDEFELAGFDEETCEQLREIVRSTGIDPYAIISVTRGLPNEPNKFEQLAVAWSIFKLSMWQEFVNSRIGKFLMRFADKLSKFFEWRKGK